MAKDRNTPKGAEKSKTTKKTKARKTSASCRIMSKPHAVWTRAELLSTVGCRGEAAAIRCTAVVANCSPGQSDRNGRAQRQCRARLQCRRQRTGTAARRRYGARVGGGAARQPSGVPHRRDRRSPWLRQRRRWPGARLARRTSSSHQRRIIGSSAAHHRIISGATAARRRREAQQLQEQWRPNSHVH